VQQNLNKIQKQKLTTLKKIEEISENYAKKFEQLSEKMLGLEK
jgi:regulatory protein YycH of two-component signal transduction system YycFG